MANHRVNLTGRSVAALIAARFGGRQVTQNVGLQTIEENMEKLIIHNFIGIKKIDIHLGQINILIGPQATGKSICAKLCYFFKGFLTELLSAVENERTKREQDSLILKKFEEYFPSQAWGKSKFKVRYEINDLFIEINRRDPLKAKLQLTYSDFFKKELNRLRRQFDLSPIWWTVS